LVEAVPEMESGKRLELSDKSLFLQQDRKQIPIIYIDRIRISYRRSYSGIKSENIEKTIVRITFCDSKGKFTGEKY
jgi:hypothetical protein